MDLVIFCDLPDVTRRVWRYQRGNQNPYIEEGQTTQWPKEKVHKDKQRSTKHTNKIKDRVTWTPLKTGCELRCSGRIGSSCSTSGTRRVNLKPLPFIIQSFVLTVLYANILCDQGQLLRARMSSTFRIKTVINKGFLVLLRPKIGILWNNKISTNLKVKVKYYTKDKLQS